MYPPTVNWNILHQRPNQILKVLARNGFKCYFMNHTPGINGQFSSKKIEEIEENLFIVPRNTDMSKLTPDVYYFSYPPFYKWIDLIKPSPKFIIFDAIDSPTGEFEAWKPLWEASVKRADLVMAVSKVLYKEAKELNDNVITVKNGVEFEHYQKSTRNPYKKLKMKGFNRKKPIVGFAGAIASWVDLDLMYESCNEYSECNFIVLGMEYNVTLEDKPKNLFFLGHKPYSELPMWINNFDVCTIPFKDNVVTRACNPLKFWEYLATGNPVVTSNLPETNYNGVYWARNSKEYLEFIGVGLAEKELAECNYGDIRKELALWGSWENNCKPLIKKLRGLDFD